jgi:hypothetical protein
MSFQGEIIQNYGCTVLDFFPRSAVQLIFLYICPGCHISQIFFYLAWWLERVTANAEVATVLGSIPTSSDTVESEGRQMKQCWIQYMERKKIQHFFEFISKKNQDFRSRVGQFTKSSYPCFFLWLRTFPWPTVHIVHPLYFLSLLQYYSTFFLK